MTKHLETLLKADDKKSTVFYQSERPLLSAVMADLDFAESLIKQVKQGTWLQDNSRRCFKDVVNKEQLLRGII